MPADQVDIQDIHQSYRNGKLDYLIGAGVSIDAGLPSWSALNNRLLELFFEHEFFKEAAGGRKLPLEPEPDELAALASIFVRRFNREPVVDLVRNNIGDDFSELLRRALYGTHGDVVLQALQYELAAALEPEEHGRLRRLLTTNFDNLLERAFYRLHHVGQDKDLQARAKVLTGAPNTVDGDLEFIHLHGYLPPDENVPAQGTLVLSEQDFWKTQEKYWATDLLEEILFDEERDLLVVGMSLADPRLREVLFERARQHDDGKECGQTYVLLTRHQPSRAAPLAERRAHKLLGRYETDYWRDLGVNIVPVEDLKLLPMLLRQIRLGDQPETWCDQARAYLGEQTKETDEDENTTTILERLHRETVQREAHDYLQEQLRFVRPKFEVSLNEQLTLGFFVPSPWGGAAISLAFRHTEHPHDNSYIASDKDGASFQLVSAEKAQDRVLDITSVAEAQGAAGYSFVTGSLVEALHSSSHINRMFTDEMKQQWDSGRTFSSLLCVPIYGSRDWVPLGVGFLSSTRKQPFWNGLSANERLQLYALIRASFRELLGYGQFDE